MRYWGGSVLSITILKYSYPCNVLSDNDIFDHYNVCFISGLDDEEDFSCPPALETIEVQQQQVLIRILHFDINCLIKKSNVNIVIQLIHFHSATTTRRGKPFE